MSDDDEKKQIDYYFLNHKAKTVIIALLDVY